MPILVLLKGQPLHCVQNSIYTNIIEGNSSFPFIFETDYFSIRVGPLKSSFQNENLDLTMSLQNLSSSFLRIIYMIIGWNKSDLTFNPSAYFSILLRMYSKFYLLHLTFKLWYWYNEFNIFRDTSNNIFWKVRFLHLSFIAISWKLKTNFTNWIFFWTCVLIQHKNWPYLPCR